jgi:hypothetical protein
MQSPTSPHAPIDSIARMQPRALVRTARPRRDLRPRHLEANAVAWLRSLRQQERQHRPSPDTERAGRRDRS